MVQYEDLDASTISFRPRGLSPNQKKALASTAIALACIALLVAVSSTTSLSQHEIETESTGLSREARYALKRDATISKLSSAERKRSQMLRQFDALQNKIEKDLGMGEAPQQAAAAAANVRTRPQSRASADAPRNVKMATWSSASYGKAAQPRTQKMADWEYEPDSYSYTAGDNAEASATLSASQAQDALHRIELLEKEAQSIRDEMAGRANDVVGAREQINKELSSVYSATEAAEESLDRAAAVQKQASEALQDAQSIREEELHRAQRIAEIEQQIEAESQYIHQVLGVAEHGGEYATGLMKEAAYADHAVRSIHDYLGDAFTLTHSLSETSTEARSRMAHDISDADDIVNELAKEASYGGHAAMISQHYAAAAREFAAHAAGSAKGAHDAVQGTLKSQETSVQAAFQAVQAAKGAKAAEIAASSARTGAEAALRMARAVLNHAYGYYAPELPTSNPVERAENLVDRMAPILNKAADELEQSEGDCTQIAQIIDAMKTEVKPISESGEDLKMSPVELKEVQSYADKVLGSTLERLMVAMMKAVQSCGPSVVGDEEEQPVVQSPAPEEPEEHPGEPEQGQAEDDSAFNVANDGGARPIEGESPVFGAEAAVISAKQMVDSRVDIISGMIDKIEQDMEVGNCEAIRQETENARADFNYLESEEIKILQGMPPAYIDEVDSYAQIKLMPLLQTSLDTFDRVKAQCGREIFADMPTSETPSGEYVEQADNQADNQQQEEQQQQQEEQQQQQQEQQEQQEQPAAAEAKQSVGPKPTALVLSSKLVIDHMVQDMKGLMAEVSKDPSNCKAATNAGTVFRAKFSALEHIAARYEARMGEAERGQVEQYAEDKLGSTMQDMFTVVMQVTANCGTKSFDVLGAHEVEEFYEDEVRDTMEQRAKEAMDEEEAARGPFNEALPKGEPNPEAEETVSDMKREVSQLKKKLLELRKKSGKDAGKDGKAADGKAADGKAADGKAAAPAADGKAADGKAADGKDGKAAAAPAAAK